MIIADLPLLIFGTLLNLRCFHQMSFGNNNRPVKLGPSFHAEPPPIVYFSNDTGTIVDCSAHGTPPPKIKWIYAEGGIVLGGEGSGLREVLAHNQSLRFLPFSPLRFNSDIHRTDYRCIATSESGTAVSAVVRIRAVLSERLDIRILNVPISPGNPALLSCQVQRRDSSSIIEFLKVERWEKDGKVIDRNENKDGKHLHLSNGDLAVLNVELSDSVSQYRCAIKNTLTGITLMSPTASIQIISSAMRSKPIILHSSVGKSSSAERNLLEVNPGDTAILPCFSSGSPPPFTSWFKENHHLLDPLPSSPRYHHFGNRGSALKIHGVQRGDAGTYRCVARNEIGESSHSINLGVLSLEKNSAFSSTYPVSVTPDIQSADIGSNARFACGSQQEDVKWLMNGNPLRDSRVIRRGSGIEIRNVRKEDGGIYQCFVTINGNEFQAMAELRLGDSLPRLQYAFIEQTLQPGPMVSLKCSATGSPTPIIKWKLDGFDLPLSDRYMIGQYVTVHGDVISHLNISRSLVEDGGLYSCSVINRAGSVHHRGRLNIYGPPKIRPFPEEIKAIEGKVFTLHCPLGGFPIEKVGWKKDNLALISNLRRKVLNNGTLVLSDVAKERDEGEYKCTGTNRQGLSAVGKTKISVIVSPKIVPFSAPASLQQGERLSLTCTIAKGDAPLTITWLKNDRSIQAGTGLKIISFDSYNSMLTIESLSLRHIGTYSCLARNKAGSAEYSQSVSVNVPPEIEPFTFGDNLREGSRTRVVCGILRGDLPIHLKWLKDGSPLTNGQISSDSGDPQITVVDDFSSLLTISDLRSRLHSGIYSCVAENPAGQASFKAPLTVKVPPAWKIKPHSTSSVQGESAELRCQAEGSPAPNIVWKKEMVSQPGEFIEIIPPINSGIWIQSNAKKNGDGEQKVRASSDYGITNSTLIIDRSDKSHSGRYLCLVSNGIGQDLHQFFNFTVKVPPRVTFPDRTFSINSALGDKIARLNCEAEGDKPITVTWSRGDHNIDVNSDPRYSLETAASQVGIKSILNIHGVVENDETDYSCIFINAFGRSRAVIKLNVQEPPPPPKVIHIVEILSRSVRLSWSSSRLRDLPIIRYFVEWVAQKVPWDLAKTKMIARTEDAISKEEQVHLDGLRPNVYYKVRISAENSLGRGQSSSELRFLTRGDKPDEKPERVKVVPGGTSDSLVVRWEDPDENSWNGRITSYRIGWKLESSSGITVESNQDEGKRDGYNWTAIERHDRGDLVTILRGLNPNSRYEILIQAQNRFGFGPVAKTIGTTAEDVPLTPPHNLICTSMTSSSLQITWTPPNVKELRGRLHGYRLYFRDVGQVGQGDTSLGIKEVMTPSVILSSLNKFANYSVMVTAFNSAGEGPFSPPFFCTTKEDVPGPPGRVRTFPLSDRSVLVSWLPPKEPNGLIVSYTLYTRMRSGTSSSLADTQKTSIRRSARHYVVNGLKQSVFYQFWVSASTKFGEGIRSDIHGERVIADGRTRPFIHSLGHEIRVEKGKSATFPCRHMGPPRSVDRTWVQNGRVAHQSRRILFHEEDLIINEVIASDAGNYSCIIERALSRDSIYYILNVMGVPESPKLELLIASTNSLTFSWSVADEEDKYPPVINCIINHKRKYGSLYETVVPPLTNFTLKHLNCGTQYSIFVTCFNFIGPSSSSNTLAVSTTGAKPSSSLKDAFIFPSNDSVRLDLYSWDVDNEGCPIRYFVVDYRRTTESSSYSDKNGNQHSALSSWSMISNNLRTTSRRFTVRQLNPLTDYELRVVANNEAGSTSAYYKFRTLSNAEAAANLAAMDDSGLSSSKEASSSSSSDSGNSWLNSNLIAVPIVITAIIIVSSSIGVAMCLKKRRRTTDKGFYLSPEENARSHLEDAVAKENMKNFQMMKEEQLYATIGAPSSTSSIQPLPPPPAGLSLEPGGGDKRRENPEDIYPYATFVLPDTEAGDETLRHIVYHENQTLPMSDAYSKSSESNVYTTLHHVQQQPKRTTHRSRRKPPKPSTNLVSTSKKKKKKKPIPESDSDSPVEVSSSSTSSPSSNGGQYLGVSSRTESADQMDVITGSSAVVPKSNKLGLSLDVDTTTDDEIFVKRGNQFVSLKSSQLKGRLPKDILKLVTDKRSGANNVVSHQFEDSSDCDISTNPYSCVDV